MFLIRDKFNTYVVFADDTNRARLASYGNYFAQFPKGTNKAILTQHYIDGLRFAIEKIPIDNPNDLRTLGERQIELLRQAGRN